jgi:enoyl-CoA hydratase
MPSVTCDVDEAVAVITIDRPPVNAYDAALEAELAAAWQAAAGDGAARVLVLRAEGRHFSAGADLAGAADWDEGHGRPGEAMAFIRDIPKPTIAAVQGGCVGGAQRWVFPCDLVFCADDAFFRDPLPSMGLGAVLAAMDTWMYGPRIAKEMLFSGARMAATQLHAAGMVNRIYPRETLWPETLAFARHVATMDPIGLAEAKQAVNATVARMGQDSVPAQVDAAIDARGAS